MPAPRHLAWMILLAFAGGVAALLATAGRSAPPVRTVRAVPSPAPELRRPATAPAPPAYTIKRVLDTGGPIRFGSWFWDETGVPGVPTLVTIDIAAEVLSVFRGGYEIGTTAIIYGADHKPTPLGIFPILAKYEHHVSLRYGNAPMPYTLRLTEDGVSIHGSAVASGYATHGCVGVPKDFARKLFTVMKVGDKVVVTRGEQLAVGGAVSALK